MHLKSYPHFVRMFSAWQAVYGIKAQTSRSLEPETQNFWPHPDTQVLGTQVLGGVGGRNPSKLKNCPRVYAILNSVEFM
jgi:hypothetical protein